MTQLTPADKVIMAGSLLFVLVLYYFFWVGGGEAKHVEIFVKGEKRYVYNLSENHKINVPGKIGESLIEIADSKIRFVHSPCNTQFCVRSGWHEHSGSFAACLPNGVSVRLTGVGKMYDAINF